MQGLGLTVNNAPNRHLSVIAVVLVISNQLPGHNLGTQEEPQRDKFDTIPITIGVSFTAQVMVSCLDGSPK